MTEPTIPVPAEDPEGFRAWTETAEAEAVRAALAKQIGVNR